LESPLGQTLLVRWAVTQILYRLHWRWLQGFFWRVLKPMVAWAAGIFVINWAKRMK
jgi:hypothetical protein